MLPRRVLLVDRDEIGVGVYLLSFPSAPWSLRRVTGTVSGLVHCAWIYGAVQVADVWG